MDLNSFFYHHQVSLMRAARASCRDARVVQEKVAHRYAELIEGDRLGRRHRGILPAKLSCRAFPDAVCTA